MTADLAPAWSTAVTVPCTLTTAPVSTEWRSAATRAPAVRPPESSGLADGEAGPVLGDLGDPIDVADGVRVGYRSHLGPDAAGVSPPGPRAAGLRRRYLRVPAERGIHRAGRYFRSCVFVGVGVGRVLLSDGAPPSQYSPGASWEAWGYRGGGPGTVPGWASSGESGVPDLAVPGTGEMTVGGVSIAPARRFVLGRARPAGHVPHRVPVELHPGTRGTAALRFECSFPWGCGAAARNRSIPRTADGQYQRVGPHPAVSGADGSSAAQPLIPATGLPECLCGTSGSARSPRAR